MKPDTIIKLKIAALFALLAALYPLLAYAQTKINLATQVQGTLPVTNGGTGFASITANRIPYATASNTLGTAAGLTYDGTTFTTGTATVSTGALTVTAGDTILGATLATIRSNTSDAADSKRIVIGGGGAIGDTRGGHILVSGNESSTPGVVSLLAGNVSGGQIQFNTGNTTLRGFITEAGVWVLGTATISSGSRLEVISNGHTTVSKTGGGATQTAYKAHNDATSGDNTFHLFYTEATETLRGSITYNRGGGVTAYNTTSDERAKIRKGVFTGSGAMIDAVPVSLGRMNDATLDMPVMNAHEIQAVAPYAVTGTRGAVDEKGNPIYQQVSYQALIPLMWAEIQSLRARLAVVEGR